MDGPAPGQSRSPSSDMASSASIVDRIVSFARIDSRRHRVVSRFDLARLGDG
jgi:hypothetical protein